MTIADVREKCKSILARVPRDVLVVGVLMLASSASFGLGFLTGLDNKEGSGKSCTDSITEATTSASVVASKTGTKYYFVWCAGANRISTDNKVWFVSDTLAEKAGYTLATNCVPR